MQEIIDYNADEHVSDKVTLAGIGNRFVAIFIDGLLLGPIFILLNIYTIEYHIYIEIILLLVHIAYKPWMEYQYGATLGKMVMKIRVVNQNFQPITLEQAILRSIIYSISSIYSIVTLLMFLLFNIGMVDLLGWNIDYLGGGLRYLFSISCLFAHFNEYDETLHDIMAKTYVIKRKA